MNIMHNTMPRCIFLIAIIGFAKSQTKVGDSCVDRYTSTVGRCKAADACESARIDYQQNGIRPTFCTYSAFGTTLVCCRDGGNFLHTASEPSPSRPSWGTDNNRQTDERRVSERNDKDTTTEKPSDDVVKPFIHYYAKDDIAADQPASSTQGVELEDRDFSTKDHTDTVSTEEELIARVWAMKLKRLLTEQRRYAEKIINDVLFEAEMGTLMKDHVNMMQREMQKQTQPDSVVTATEATKMAEKEAKMAEKDAKMAAVSNVTVDNKDVTSSYVEKSTENLPILQLQLTINNPEDKNN